ncbi:MAG: site-specific integrase [Firmicutes bacterium]|nr:site-specific integrase [Bacillota bacterium]
MNKDTLELILSELTEIRKLINVSPLSAPSAPAFASPMLFDWLSDWYKVYKEPNLKQNSLRQILNCISHIKRHLENKPLHEINGIQIQKALNQIPQSRTRKYVLQTLNNALNQAVKLGLLSINPITAVEPVKHSYKRGTALTDAEQVHFAQILKGNKHRALYLFYILSGCRRNEGLALKWQDISFSQKTIHIKGTKTETSNRIIPLFPALYNLLAGLPFGNSTSTVFNTTLNALKSNFRRLQDNHGLNFRIHDLRHTFATNCLKNGISMKTIQKWLGHSRLETTANIYTHIQTDFELSEVEKYKPIIPP